MPGVGGKIGKLLERGVTPTVLKHQGRIQLSKDSAKTSKIINSPSTRSGKALSPFPYNIAITLITLLHNLTIDKRPESEGLLEVSVLEKMPSGKSSIPIRQKPAYPCRKNWLHRTSPSSASYREIFPSFGLSFFLFYTFAFWVVLWNFSKFTEIV